MLILSLTAVARSPVRLEGQISPDDAVWDGTGLTLVRPLRVDLEARMVGEGILVRGEIATEIETGCRRCLTPVVVDVNTHLDLLFEPLTAEEEVELGGDVYPLPSRGDQLDLAPAIREQVLLKIPDYVLCGESCLGLCPHCGTELNRTTCTCSPAPVHGPWDALKDIKFD